MRTSYNKSLILKCITCGDSDFQFNTEKTWIKCNRCEREYDRGYEELVELNEELINTEIEKTKAEITSDLKDDLHSMFKKAFNNSKNIKFK